MKKLMMLGVSALIISFAVLPASAGQLSIKGQLAVGGATFNGGSDGLAGGTAKGANTFNNSNASGYTSGQSNSQVGQRGGSYGASVQSYGSGWNYSSASGPGHSMTGAQAGSDAAGTTSAFGAGVQGSYGHSHSH